MFVRECHPLFAEVTGMPEYDLTTTEHLRQVIDALQLGRKAGVLTVERGEEPFVERGMIIFVNGQPVRAKLGNLNTAEALERLATWQTCRFAFSPDIPPDLMPTSPAIGGGYKTPSRPLPGIRQISPLLPPDPGKRYGERNSEGRPSALVTPGQLVPHRLRQVDETLYIMNQQGFSRVHRRLLLLIDGSRAVKELALLLGKSPDEVAALLHQMIVAGLIFY